MRNEIFGYFKPPSCDKGEGGKGYGNVSIMGLEDLNSQFRNKHVTFSEGARSKMFEYQGTIIAAIMQKVIEVNNSN